MLKQTLLRSAGHVIIPDFIPDRVRFPETAPAEVAGGSDDGTDLRHFVDERLEADSTDLYAEALEFMERYVVTRVLRVCDGNQSKAARMLGHHSRLLAEQSSGARRSRSTRSCRSKASRWKCDRGARGAVHARTRFALRLELLVGRSLP